MVVMVHMQLLSQSLRTNTVISVLCLGGNNIGDRGGCSLAEALGINKGLVELEIVGNPLGEKSIQHLIHSLQLNNTLQHLNLPCQWKDFLQNCVGYNETKRGIFFGDWSN